jgi:hypothetical protein
MAPSSPQSFVVRPLAAAAVTRFRSTGRDDFGRPFQASIATGGEPMRDQLRRAIAGERLLLGSYQAVPLPSPFAEIGPIYVSAEGAPVSVAPDTLPPGYFNRLFALRAYDDADRIAESTLVEPAAAGDTFRAWLARPEIAYLHARFAGHGCFAARIDRA